MNIKLGVLAVGALFAVPAYAQEGDAAAGEKAFSQCQTCHVVETPEGETLAGRNAKTGPNLYGVIGRQAGTIEGFRYGDDLIRAGEQGLVWDEASFTSYVQDPSAFLKEYLDDSKARGKMAFKVRREEDAANLYAFINSLSPASDEAATN